MLYAILVDSSFRQIGLLVCRILVKILETELLITAQPMDCFAERIPLENKQLVGCGGAQ
jgi:hypothetical protein